MTDPMRTYAVLAQSYAAQSRYIDIGEAGLWAGTFTPNGVFSSPTYQRSFQGAEELERFAVQFHESAALRRQVWHHVVTNICVVSEDAEQVQAAAVLCMTSQEAGRPVQLDRVVELEDEWRWCGPSLKLARRNVQMRSAVDER